MQRLRIVIAGVTPLLADILVDGLSRDPRVDVVRLADPYERGALAAAVLVQEPHLLILGARVRPSLSETLHMLYGLPHLVVVTIATASGNATFYRLQLETSVRPDIGMQELIGSILDLCGAPP